jgi:hypothetical protein
MSWLPQKPYLLQQFPKDDPMHWVVPPQLPSVLTVNPGNGAGPEDCGGGTDEEVDTTGGINVVDTTGGDNEVVTTGGLDEVGTTGGNDELGMITEVDDDLVGGMIEDDEGNTAPPHEPNKELHPVPQ